MSRRKLLIQILESCEPHEFNEIIKSYLKSVYNYKRIVTTDGKNDCGIDLKVFDIGKLTVQYQLTTQRSSTNREKKQFEEKLFSDIKKAQINYESYSYDPTLYFFYSYAIYK